MAYATLDDMRALLPENITIGNLTGVNVMAPKRDTIPLEVAKRYLTFASQLVDSRLSTLYRVPLNRVVEARSPITHNMLPGSTDVMVQDVTPFRIGACVRLKDTNGQDVSQVKDIPEKFNEGVGLLCNLHHLTLVTPTINAYDPGSDAIVEMIVYPDPVTPMTAKFAVSLMFDKLYTSTASPDMSNYGKSLRNQAREDLDAILTGQTRLKGQEFIGRRFVRQTLYDGFKIPGENQPGQGRE